MSLVNLEGIILVGPGSEWFWAMAQFLVLLVTGLAIYRQFRVQASANALNVQNALVSQWDSPEMIRMRLAALIHVAAGEPGQPPTFGTVGNFFAYIAALREHGHVTARDSWETWSLQVQLWWALAERWLPELRAKNQGIYGEFEALAHAMNLLDRQNRVPNFDPEDLDVYIDRQITRLIGRLQLAEDAKQGRIPAWPPAAANDGPQAAASQSTRGAATTVTPTARRTAHISRR